MSAEPPLPPGEAAALLDTTGTVRRWNEAAAELLGVAAAEALGRDLPGLLFPEELRAAHAGGLAPFVSMDADPPFRPVGRWSIPVLQGDGRVALVDAAFEHCDRDGEDWYQVTFHPHGTAVSHAVPTAAVLERIVEHAPEAITLIGRDGRQVFVNERGLEVLGYGTRRGTGLTARLLVHPDDLPGLYSLRGGTVDAHGVPLARRFRARTLEGSWRWFETVAADLLDDPVVEGYLVFTRDVTVDAERAEALRTAESRLEAVVQNVTGAALLAAPDDASVLWNRALVELAFPGEPVTLAVPAAGDVLAAVGRRAREPDAAARLFARLGTDGGAEILDLADGRSLEIESVGIQRGADSLGRLWLLRDVTERVLAALQREQLLALEQEARRLAEEQAARLQEFDELRTDFVATVSHELRTPLTSVLSAVDYLRSGTTEEQAEDLPGFLELIERNARRLSRLVDDLLVVSRLDAGMLVLEEHPVDPPALVAGVVEDLLPLARDRAVRVELASTPGPALLGDPGRLAQVVANLVANAVKFTAEGTAVEISCAPGDAGWTIAVRDHGPGVDPSEQDRVFERFYRARQAGAGGTPGSGLGLTIARGLVELHGGHLTVHAAPGGGAEFRCVLPWRVPRS